MMIHGAFPKADAFFSWKAIRIFTGENRVYMYIYCIVFINHCVCIVLCVNGLTEEVWYEDFEGSQTNRESHGWVPHYPAGPRLELLPLLIIMLPNVLQCWYGDPLFEFWKVIIITWGRAHYVIMEPGPPLNHLSIV